MDPNASSAAAMQQFLQQWPAMHPVNPYMGGNPYGQAGLGGFPYPYGAGLGAGANPMFGEFWNGYVPPLAVRVEGLSFHYQLTDDDVRKVFSRYGHVQSVDVKHGGNLAYIQFLSTAHALAAIEDLDGKTLAGLKGGKLRVAFDTGMAGGAAGAGAASRWSGQGAGAWGWQGQQMAQTGGEDGVKKFTCKVEFDIDNDKEFRVSSKVIAVARRIWMELPHFQERGGKTRLRGKGSGFLEGADQKEADEPLHLCISCRDQASFEEAVSMAVKEIQQIQRDFIAYRKQKGLPVPKNLGCKVERQTRGGADDASQPPPPPQQNTGGGQNKRVSGQDKSTDGNRGKWGQKSDSDAKRGGRKGGNAKGNALI
eukprot:GEMP01001825.1.p1 GENE.GEMP01001825.1~~GEMP01001825.1.p1  ORF type:complete len:379 (-),score=66.43 GEMP01001825.1:4021-5121(-)